MTSSVGFSSVLAICLAAVVSSQRPETIPVESISEFPYIASIQEYGLSEHTGIILDELHILSSAVFVNPFYLRVVVGQNDWTNNDETDETIQIRNVSKVNIHPEECSPEYDMIANNLAVFTLEEPLEFNENVQPIQLPTQGDASQGSGVITGWINATGTTILHQLPSVQFLDSTLCRSILGRIKYRTAHLCVGFIKPDGDSVLDGDYGFDKGSPVVTPDESGLTQGTVYGILSYANPSPKCEPGSDLGFPIVFTEVSKYVNWIQGILSL